MMEAKMDQQESTGLGIIAAPRLLLTPRQAAKALSISEKTLYNYTKSGDIPVVRFGRCVRYAPDDLKRWIEKFSRKNS